MYLFVNEKKKKMYDTITIYINILEKVGVWRDREADETFEYQ